MGGVPLDTAGEEWAWAVEMVLRNGFFDMYRPVAGYIDYTFSHLPSCKNGIPPLKNVVARLAILAARMAFSSF